MWGTVTWHCPRLYPDPDHLQNPYEDSMAWQPRKPMNTGEGKYLYPPPECFETKDPVIAGPVDSIRFEMVRASFNHPSVVMFGFLNECASGRPECKTLVDAQGRPKKAVETVSRFFRLKR